MGGYWWPLKHRQVPSCGAGSNQQFREGVQSGEFSLVAILDGINHAGSQLEGRLLKRLQGSFWMGSFNIPEGEVELKLATLLSFLSGACGISSFHDMMVEGREGSCYVPLRKLG